MIGGNAADNVDGSDGSVWLYGGGDDDIINARAGDVAIAESSIDAADFIFA